MQVRQNDQANHLLFEGKVRVSHVLGVRFLSGLLMALDMFACFILSLHLLQAVGLWQEDLKGWSVASFIISGILVWMLGDWLHNKIWERPVRIWDLGDQACLQVGHDQAYYKWQTLRKVRAYRFYARRGQVSTYNLVLVFEGRTYRFSSSDKSMVALSQLGQALQAYLKQG
ncbi:hypothetical protein [Abiotrophia defectiva]|uniref:hypothetical protein n=1 Tax=Abiotrophia defectiva TaxID=46125 RepID=UPI0028D35A9B|nr:hypothetical protein [Abiotrophia defectiva]